MYNIPILLICFNRPQKTQCVFDSIKGIKPRKLYIAIDGPRNQSDISKVDSVKNIVSDVDWDCEVYHLINDHNKGCKVGVYDSITWFFQHEEMGIILEDDIVPYYEFYGYCEDLLHRYKNDKRIACISGWSYFYENVPANYDYTYYFSHIQSSWGWATWKDRWEPMKLELEDSDWFKIYDILKNDMIDNSIIEYYNYIYHNKHILSSAWDYPYMFTCLMLQNRYCIQPMKRLVKNIGNGPDGTHPTNVDLNKSPKINDNFKIIHPEVVEYLSWLDNERNKQTNEHL